MIILAIENITLGNIQDVLTFIATTITSVGVIGAVFYKLNDKKQQKQQEQFKEEMQKLLEPFNKRIDETIKNNNKNYRDTIEKIKSVQLYADKNFLVRFLADVEQGNIIDEVEKERFYEVYKDYRKLGGNSYVQRKVEKLEKEGKL